MARWLVAQHRSDRQDLGCFLKNSIKGLVELRNKGRKMIVFQCGKAEVTEKIRVERNSRNSPTKD